MATYEVIIDWFPFSEAMNDCVTADQQRREEQNAVALNSPLSEELIRTGQWIQDNRGELASNGRDPTPTKRPWR